MGKPPWLKLGATCFKYGDGDTVYRIMALAPPGAIISLVHDKSDQNICKISDLHRIGYGSRKDRIATLQRKKKMIDKELAILRAAEG